MSTHGSFLFRKMKERWAFVLLGFLGLLVAYGTYLPPEDPCAYSSELGNCFGERVQKIIKERGLATGVAYVHNVLLADYGFEVVHMLLHDVGMYAYAKEKDLSRALAYIDPYARTAKYPEYIDGFDGYYHGVIMGFFMSNRDRDVQDLILDVCERDLVLPGGEKSSTPFNCYHAIGHALMHLYGNVVEKSLRVCDTVVEHAKKEGCYQGVFMENAYLYSSAYSRGVSRESVQGSSMAALCNKQQGLRAETCSRFVGQSYLGLMRPTDLRGAFKECEKVSEHYEVCAQWLSVMFIPIFYGEDHTLMTKACGLAHPLYREVCIETIDFGVDYGFGNR